MVLHPLVKGTTVAKASHSLLQLQRREFLKCVNRADDISLGSGPNSGQNSFSRAGGHLGSFEENSILLHFFEAIQAVAERNDQ